MSVLGPGLFAVPSELRLLLVSSAVSRRRCTAFGFGPRLSPAAHRVLDSGSLSIPWGGRRHAATVDETGDPVRGAGRGRESKDFQGSLWARFVRESYSRLGDWVYPSKADICNCGADFGYQLPRVDLLLREGMEPDSKDWRMQMYGATLYWHCATHFGALAKDVDVDMLRGKDVLEVACMRGGGARWLAEVVGTRTYLATDNVEQHIERAQKAHKPWPGLRYELADATSLSGSYAAESFDFVLCIQASLKVGTASRFIRSVVPVLRPGGRVIICDAFLRDQLKEILDAADAEGLTVEVCADMSRAVHAVGLCTISKGLSYLRLLLRKPAAEQVAGGPDGDITDAGSDNKGSAADVPGAAAPPASA